MLTQRFRWNIPTKFDLLSTDTKPTDCPNGSRVNEIDTGKKYLFDEENKVWYETSGGGSSTIDTQVNGTSENAVQNKAIYNFVNSSVATNTANFIGTFNSVAELEAYSGTVTNNDYAFVIGTDSSGNTVYNRYKYNGSSWGFEYALNNSSFTAAQWATIQSGLTASDKTKLDGIEAGANKTVVDANLSQTSTNPVQNKVVNEALATKQDTIVDLAEIRSGAAAGSTAVQQVAFEADKQRQDDAIDALTNVGAKNALRLDSYKNQTADSNVTFTWNETAGTITAVNSSATPKVTTYQLNVTVTRSGRYTFTCGEGSATAGDDPDSLYDCYLYSDGTVIRDNDPTTTEPGSTAYIEAGTYRLDIRIHNGVTVNTVFKPMLRPAALTDTEYVPYAMSNVELTDMFTPMTQAEYDALVTKDKPIYFIYEA